MNLFDPNRKRINDIPELLGKRVVVPRLNLFPNQDETITISAMIPNSGSGRYLSRQVTRIIPDEKLSEIINSYRLDPENTLETLFEINLSSINEPSDVEFAKDLKRSYKLQETQFELEREIEI